MASIISAGTTSATALNLSGDTTGILQLATGATPTTAVTIDASQNVGIGTSSTIAGTRLIVKDGYTAFQFNSGATYPTYNSYFGAIGTNFQSGASYLDFWNNVGSGFQWHIQTGASTQTSVMTIDASGNVLVGTTSATTPFDACKIAVDSSQEGLRIRSASNVPMRFIFGGSSTFVGSITTTSSATSYNTSSDYRLKEDIAPMTGALNVVQALNPVTYKWKADGSDGQGFIAHELAEIVPDCVSGEKDAVDADGNPQYQGIDTSFLVATLTAAIQELKAIVDLQQTKITALNAKVGI